MPKLIRIFFVNCPTLDTDAASHLLLAQNAVQDVIEFEVVHYWIISDTLEREREREGTSTRGKCERLCIRLRNLSWCPTFLVGRLHRYLRTQSDLREAPFFKRMLTFRGWHQTVSTAVNHYIVNANAILLNRFQLSKTDSIFITETPIEGNLFALCDNGLGVVSIADWKRFFKPGSAFEFILAAVQRNAIRLAFSNVGSHYPTRGCVWDYSANKPDARISASTGFLCADCRIKLGSAASPQEMEAIDKLISNQWIGHLSQDGSIASVLYNGYGYELNRASGLRGGLSGILRRGVRSELGAVVVEIAKWVAIVILSLAVVKFFPEVASKILPD